jgi:benzylsuccinate CoA-transferase BbsE subunit
MGGPLAGLRMVEMAHEHVAWAGKLMADLGADVVVVEPPGGSDQRRWGPFLDDEPGPERSLWWWHYNTSKQGVVADLGRDRDRLLRLVADSDIFLEGEPPGRLAEAGLGWEQVSAVNPRLVMISISPFGQASPRSAEPVTDLTLLAEGGPAWMTGYDDHQLPPVRGGGNQAFQTAGNWAMMALLVALLQRENTGTGQHIDVSMLAASNVTTEMASYGWLASQEEMRRQTGRHANPEPTMKTQARCRDGRYVMTGVPPREPKVFAALLELLDRLGLRDDFPMAYMLELGVERGQISFAEIPTDPIVAEILVAARTVVIFLAEHLDAYDFFVETQKIGITTGAIYSPGEAWRDPNAVARGFPTEVEHPELDRTLMYPGPMYRFSATPWATRRAPTLGEHQDRLDGN